MESMIKKACLASAILLVSAISASAVAQTGVSARDLRSGFGRPEVITAAISSVNPDGMVVLRRRGPSEPPSTQVTVTKTTVVEPETNTVASSDQATAVKTTGETDYNFRTSGSTLIKINGQPATLPDLSNLQGKQATVRFIPKRSGNFALSIEVGE